ncbi:zinc-binding oxidoreductase ToxD [Histoplasma capsulatum var. duboisii H88]|uniref:Zinc-binding oxidoreductase ToxD n=1 Tax=Ajellomyces capsulatus (strain H88) TaxID=544711 RepID=A0A8A1LL81_AJEC8|nr:zinc-binding oxidoreductase ToxD [Histoplasma capsulatum var. duboisii H88]
MNLIVSNYSNGDSKTQRALISGPNREALVSNDFPIPDILPDHVLVKTTHVALNPADWKNLGSDKTIPGTLGGCDFSGIVEEVGPTVVKKFNKGDKVMGFNLGFNKMKPTKGAFAEYVISKGDLLLRVPDTLRMDQAASMPMGLYTVAQGLYQGILQMALPNEPVKNAVPVLIYGGSSATGALAIQFAKLSGYTVLTTCSPQNFSYVKELGADVLFDSHEEGVGKKIREYTNDNLHLVYDTISIPETAAVCADALSSKPGGKYMATQFPQMERKDVESSAAVVYTMINEEFRVGEFSFPPKPEDIEYGIRFGDIAEKLIAEGKIKAHRVLTNEDGGFAAIPDGWTLMRENKVSGRKLVYKV